MSAPVPIVMIGAAGRMGRMIMAEAVRQPERWRIAGAVDHADHPLLGQPISELVAGAPESVTLTAAPPDQVEPGTVAIHFALPEALAERLSWNISMGCAALIGTTGMGPEQLRQVKAAAEQIAVLATPNTSAGVNIVFWLAREAARLLGPDYDIEIVEMHHHHKQDAPSGTARRLAEVVLEATGGEYERDSRHGRQGQAGARRRGEVGIHALRGGDVAGDHTVVFAGNGDRIELTHRASSRQIFANGALLAAEWLSGRRPGQYTMKDVLGL